MRHRHINNRRTFGMLLNPRKAGQEKPMSDEEPTGTAEGGQQKGEECVSVETAKRRHALRHGVPSSYWRLRHHHGYVMARPV